jgi:hypothetical protein
MWRNAVIAGSGGCELLLGMTGNNSLQRRHRAAADRFHEPQSGQNI